MLRDQSATDVLALARFVEESNRIEGIHRPPTDREIDAHVRFLAYGELSVAELEEFVQDVAGVPLRRALGQDVRVGPHLPPPGGPGIETRLKGILADIWNGDLTPYQAHIEYETLHPFLDGNGRSGRALWAWHMNFDGHDPFALPFLHRWYYQSLDGGRE